MTMDKREELARLIADAVRHMDSASATGPTCPEIGSVAANAVLAAGYHRGLRIPEPGSAEWAAMVERSAQANFVLCELMQSAPRRWRDLDTAGRTVFMAIADAALRAALGLDQPHRENDERPEEQPREAG